jgi:hypothetical protein
MHWRPENRLYKEISVAQDHSAADLIHINRIEREYMTIMKILVFSLVMAVLASPIRAQEHRPFQIKDYEGEYIKIGKQIYKIPNEAPPQLSLSLGVDIIHINGQQYVAHKGILYTYDPPSHLSSLDLASKAVLHRAREAETVDVEGARYVVHGGNLYRLPSSHKIDLLSVTEDPNKPQKFQLDGETFILFHDKVHRYPKN